MLGTLGLDDDDAIDALVRVENAFDVAISDDEAKSISTAGQMFELLRGKLDADDANRKCASAMALYRVRRTLNDLGVGVGRAPSSDLSGLDRVYTKSFVKSLEQRSALRMPQPAFGLVGNVGCALIFVGIFGALAGIVAAFPLIFISDSAASQLLVASIILLVGGLVAGVALLCLDAGRLPKNCRTLGALAANAANLSYGRLVKQGADGRDSRMWKTLVEILSDFADVPADQIARETYFLASALKRRKSAA
jgi:hypothetical protein